MTQDDSFSSRVFSPEVVFCFRNRALLYAALNFREPVHFVNDNRQKVSIGMTDLEYYE